MHTKTRYSALSLSLVGGLTMTLGAVACSSLQKEATNDTSQADLGSAKSLVACPSDNSDPNCPAGSFAVTCTDGSTEVDSQSQVLANDVCTVIVSCPSRPASCPAVAPGSEVACGKNDACCPSGYYLWGCADGSLQCTRRSSAPPSLCAANGGLSVDAGSTTSTDPFDPASCSGTPLTQAQAAALFQAGATESIIGSYTVQMRQRSCNAVTGCGAWGATTTQIGAVLGGGRRALSGQIKLYVQNSAIGLSLLDSTAGTSGYEFGTRCSEVNGTAETCTSYSYNLGDQWGGGGGMVPTATTLVDTLGHDVPLSGVLTSQCLRLTNTVKDTSGNDVQEFVVLAPVSAGSPPPPNPCPGGGTQMACGGRAAAGMMTCCGAGLTTCPQSGCDCWAACQ